MLISSFFKLDIKKTKVALENYFLLSTKYDTRKINDCVELCNELNLLLFNKTVLMDKTKKLISYSRDLVKDSYQEFLDALI